jgi:radical SAM protein with 4Fe4S-binding SPASM domain
VNIISVVTSANASDLDAIVLAFQDAGIHSVQFSPFLRQGAGAGVHDKIAPAPETMAASLLRIIDGIASGQIVDICVMDVIDLIARCLNWGQPPMCHRGGPCGAARDMMAIYPDGTVYACDCLVDSAFLLGRLDHRTTLISMTTSNTANRLAERHPARMDPCSRCALQRSCGGTMVCRSFWSTGDIMRPDSGECSVSRTVLPHLYRALTEHRRLVDYFLRWKRVVSA